VKKRQWFIYEHLSLPHNGRIYLKTFGKETWPKRR